jgi:uncharacterized protein (DUF2164 family)
MNIMSCYFERYRETEIKKVSMDELEFLDRILGIYLYI